MGRGGQTWPPLFFITTLTQNDAMPKITLPETLRTTFHSFVERHGLTEPMIYLAMWLMMLLVPFGRQLFDVLNGIDNEFSWSDVGKELVNIVPFLVLFLLNNCIFVPRLLMRQRAKRYILAIAVATVVIMVIATEIDPIRPDATGDRPNEFPPRHNTSQTLPPGGPPTGTTPVNAPPFDAPQFNDSLNEHGEPVFAGRPRKNHDHNEINIVRTIGPLPFVSRDNAPLIARIIIALLMVTFNAAVKQFFRAIRDHNKVYVLEHQNIRAELDYLKYQLNPHFFMNTLNNIHALVDIDTEKAKDTIVELSRLMRYVLYDSNRPSVHLADEVSFMNHYIELMRLRYTANVDIRTDFPVDNGAVKVPPLLFVPFIENAFKHGISYRSASFIDIDMRITNDRIIFNCRNSKAVTRADDTHHGIGLDNLHKRLNLLFDNNFELSINDGDDTFSVMLSIPVENSVDPRN